jgi:predicted aminopeptidase
MRNKRIFRWIPVLAIIASAIALSGCSTVAPYQKGNLADYTMRSDRDELATVMTSHIQFSREATTGGEGVGGGGCGCN